MPPSDAGPATPTLIRAIGVRALAANAVNQTIGASIYLLPATVAAVLGPSAILAYVVCAAAMALVALCLAEAGSRVNTSGGVFAYAEAAFGPYVGFLTGVLFVVGSAIVSSAAVATLFVGALGSLSPNLGTPLVRAAILVLLYASLALVNVRGVRTGSNLVEVVTVAKIAPLLLLVAAGVVAVNPAHLEWPSLPPLGDIGTASLILIYAFMGIEGALTPSGEVKDPARTVPRSIFLALLIVTTLYGAMHVVAQGVLGPALAGEQTTPLATAAGVAFGPTGRALVLAGAVISTFGYLTGDVLASPRLLYAFAREGLLPSAIGRIHPVFRTPHVAIGCYSALSCALALTGTFRALATLSAVATLLVYLVSCVATVQLRRRDVRMSGEPFRIAGGATVPVLACVVMFWLLGNATAREFVAVGLLLVSASLLYLFRWMRRPVAAPA